VEVKSVNILPTNSAFVHPSPYELKLLADVVDTPSDIAKGIYSHSVPFADTSTSLPERYSLVPRIFDSGPFRETGLRLVSGGIEAAFSLYQLFNNWGQMNPKLSAISGAASGAYIGSTVLPGVGTAVGALIGGAIGVMGGLMKTGKHDDQLARDQVRSLFQQRGWLDDSFSLRLADGSTYSIGRDGGYHLTNTDGSSRRAYEVDSSDPLAHEVVGMAQSFVGVLLGGHPKLTSDFTGYLTNAALSNASTLEEAKSNLRSFVEQLQLSPHTVIATISEMANQDILSRETGDAYLNGFLSLYAQESTRR
jgi:hypothetical protein